MSHYLQGDFANAIQALGDLHGDLYRYRMTMGNVTPETHDAFDNAKRDIASAMADLRVHMNNVMDEVEDYEKNQVTP